MKKIIFILTGLLINTLVFSQTSTPVKSPLAKIKLSNGQKIVVESVITIEANLGMGMDLNSSSSSENTLDVKNSTTNSYTISNTLTKLKVNMNMMGQPTNYDSEKKEDNNADMAKTFDEKLNKPVDIIIDNNTGLALTDNKKIKNKDTDEENPMQGLLNMFSESSDEGVVSGAFGLIPIGKKTGDSWSDTTIEKEIKTIRSYTLRSITANEALIQLDAVTTAVNKIDMQGMQIEFKSNTKTTGEMTTDILTGQVKKKNTTSDITGSFQLMGQDMPITAKAISASTYK